MKSILTIWFFIFLSQAVMFGQIQPNKEKSAQSAQGAVSHELFLPTSTEPVKLRDEKSIQIRFEEARNFYNHIHADRRYNTFATQEHAGFTVDNRVGLKVGETVLLPPLHDYIYKIDNIGTRIAKKDEKVGMYDFFGGVQIPFVYEYLSYFRSGQPDDFKNIDYSNSNEKTFILRYALAQFIAKSAKNKKFGVVDIFNRLVVPFEYDTIVANDMGSPTSKFIELYQEGRVSLTTLDHKTLIPFELGFEAIEIMHNLYFRVAKNGNVGIFKRGGQLVIPIQYNYLYTMHRQFIEPEGNPKYIVAVSHEKLEGGEGHKVGLINLQQDTILPLEFTAVEGILVDNYQLKNKDNEKLQFFSARNLQQAYALFDETGRQVSPFRNIRIRSIIPYGSKPLFFVGNPYTQNEAETKAEDIFISVTGEIVELKNNALLINTIKDLSGTGQVKMALATLSAIYWRDNIKNERLNLLQNSFTELERKQRSNIISPKDFEAEVEKINRAMLDLIEN
jgi:hypothetical protein